MNTIQKMLNEINSFCYSYNKNNNCLEPHLSNNNMCIRELITITNKLIDLNIDYEITEHNAICIKSA